MSSTKDTNPKDAVGTAKVPASCVSAVVEAELALAMMEGARNYGRHNYRVAGIRYSIYYDAARRHLARWWEGEDLDPDSGLSHVTKAIASLMVLRDAMIFGLYTDDRPPAMPEGWMDGLNKKAAEIIARYPDAKPAFVARPKGNEVSRDTRPGDIPVSQTRAPFSPVDYFNSLPSSRDTTPATGRIWVMPDRYRQFLEWEQSAAAKKEIEEK